MKDLYTLNEFEEEFGFVSHSADSERSWFDTHDKSELSEIQKLTNQLAKESGTEPYCHVWTVVEGDSGKLVMLNGYHLVNRMNYCISKKPWGAGNHSDKDIYIEVTYQE